MKILHEAKVAPSDAKPEMKLFFCFLFIETSHSKTL